MLDDFYIEPISNENHVNDFGMGDVEFLPLKTFLRNQALDFQNLMLAQTYVVVPKSEENKKSRKVVGYITLTCSEIDLRDYTDYVVAEDCPQANSYEALPAVKIARLAVHKKYRFNKETGRSYGIGQFLIQYAVSLCLNEITNQIGCRFLITNAKPSAFSFYEKCNFVFVETEENMNREHPVMFVDLKAIKDELALLAKQM